MNPHAITFSGEELLLYPDRSCYWPAGSTVFVADLHLGKTAAFRRHGVPLPEGPTQDTLTRLGQAARRHSARVVVLGDFWHDQGSVSDLTRPLLLEWREQFADVSLALVPGNHDRKFHALAAEARIELMEPGSSLGPFELRHHPSETSSRWVAGHLHPVVRVGHRLPCFWVSRNGLILPAFGSFTGGCVVEPSDGDEVYACLEKRVMPVSLAALRQRG